MSDQELSFTAYPSGPEGKWTVWDHVKDEAVSEGISEADARQLADELQGGTR